MKTVHVELSDKRVEILVLEPPTENLARKLFVIRDFGGRRGAKLVQIRKQDGNITYQ